MKKQQNKLLKDWATLCRREYTKNKENLLKQELKDLIDNNLKDIQEFETRRKEYKKKKESIRKQIKKLRYQKDKFNNSVDPTKNSEETIISRYEKRVQQLEEKFINMKKGYDNLIGIIHVYEIGDLNA